METEIIYGNTSSANASLVASIKELVKKIDLDTLKEKSEKSKYIKFILKNLKGYKIEIEQSLFEKYADRIDCVIYDSKDLKRQNPKVIIEIDNMRADQISKKLVSRLAMMSELENIIYIIICYTSNSAKGHKKECEKYVKEHIPNFLKHYKRVEFVAFLPKI